jgi:ABC-type uncharacterized transport system substrate-binding protein
MRPRKLLLTSALAGPLACAAAPALAHPHILVDARAEVVFDGSGDLVAIRNVWRFDAPFSALALQGFDTDGDGTYSPQELQPLSQINMESLAEYEYFTWLTVDGAKQAFAAPDEYWLTFDGDQLTLFFTLPLAAPVRVASEATFQVYDPEYFVAITFVPDTPVALKDSPPRCAAQFYPPPLLDEWMQTQLSAIPQDERVLPPQLAAITDGLANTLDVRCS